MARDAGNRGPKFIPELDTLVAPTPDGRWHHYALVHFESKAASYLDGARKASASLQEPLRLVGPIYLGARSDLDKGRFYYGALDDLRLYGCALSEEDIRSMASPTKP